ncbi:hypothetical protein CRUP_018668 [Coryphaenoides rupestris]|nr:hypothetical protein CRUP_018668 [Coryphaenoides rupestris]
MEEEQEEGVMEEEQEEEGHYTEGGHVFSGLRELPFLHALPNIPVDEGPLGIHQVKLVVEPSPGLSDGSGVAQHTHGPLDLGQISSRNHGRRDDWSICGQWEVDARVGHQVGLELSQVDVQGSVKAKGGGDGGHDLANEPVEVGVGGPFDVEVPAADVIDGFVVHHEGTVRVFQGESRSISREVKPEPVPPPKLWKIRKPWSPTH